jgi:hypothetical protein
MSLIQNLVPEFRTPMLAENSNISPICPFDLKVIASNGVYQVSIHPGTINNYLVTNYLSGVSVGLNTTKFLAIRCSTNNGKIISAELMALNDAPEAFDITESRPPISFDILIGIIINGTTYKVWNCSNISIESKESFRADKESYGPGESPYSIWYTWSIVS